MELFKRDTLTLAERLNRDFDELDLAQRLDRIGGLAYRAVFTSNLTMADHVLTRAIAMSNQPIRVATLITGRLFPENNPLLQIAGDRFGTEIEGIEADSEVLGGYRASCGSKRVDFSGDTRKAANGSDKWTSLDEALKGADVWITSRRKEDLPGAQDLPFAEWHRERGLFMINPLADWSTRQVQRTIASSNSPAVAERKQKPAHNGRSRAGISGFDGDYLSSVCSAL